MNSARGDRFFFRLVQSKKDCESYLEKRIWGNRKVRCYFCESYRPYKLSSGRWRCRTCRKDFRSWRGRWLGELRITAVQWIKVLKMFEQSVLPHQAKVQINLSYPTLLRAYHTIRKSILQLMNNKKLILQTDLFENLVHSDLGAIHDRAIERSKSIFGVKELGNRVQVFQLPENFFENKDLEKLNFYRQGKVAFCGPYEEYLVIITSADAFDNLGVQFLSQKAIKTLVGSAEFFLYVIDIFSKYHGVSERFFPLYLCEAAFRFNHREERLFPILVDLIADRKIKTAS